MEDFGYLAKSHGASAMISQTIVDEALRELQHYGNIPVTGRVDQATLDLLSRKRLSLNQCIIKVAKNAKIIFEAIAVRLNFL